MEEERRLAYVGITRAEQRLFLTNAYSRMLYGRTMSNPASRFLDELDGSVLDREDSSGSTSSMYSSKPASSGGRWKTASDTRQEKAFSQPFSAGPREKTTQSVKQTGSSGAASLGWAVGDKASHKKWGTGIVVQTSGEGDGLTLDIAFKDIGIKRLLASFAPIEKA